MDTNSTLRFSRPTDDTLLIHFSGEWKLANKLPSIDEAREQIGKGSKIHRVTFDTKELKGWDIGLLIRRFDIMPDGNVLLSARCILIGGDGMTQLLMWEASVTEPITSQTYDAKVSSMSRTLEKLSQDIADRIKAVSQE